MTERGDFTSFYSRATIQGPATSPAPQSKRPRTRRSLPGPTAKEERVTTIRLIRWRQASTRSHAPGAVSKTQLSNLPIA